MNENNLNVLGIKIPTAEVTSEVDRWITRDILLSSASHSPPYGKRCSLRIKYYPSGSYWITPFASPWPSLVLVSVLFMSCLSWKMWS